MPNPRIVTAFDHIAWSYANLARAHAALSAGRTVYGQGDHIVRARLFGGLRTGRMTIRSLYDDERLKMLSVQACSYCSATGKLTMDHLIPRHYDGSDDGSNLVLACRRCNSAKSDTDLLVWFTKRGMFPPLMILRRYIKLVFEYCERQELLSYPIDAPELRGLPFQIDRLPLHYPPLNGLTL